MTTTKKFKIYTFLFVGVIFLMSSIAMSSGKIRVFDFKYEKVEFLNGDIVLELPDKPGPLYGRMYYKVLMDEYIDLTSGHGEISDLSVSGYEGQRGAELDSKLVVKTTREIRKNHNIIFRRVIWYGKNLTTLVLATSWNDRTFPTEAEKQERIQKDDEIFEHIVESFRYRKEDGTYAKPEIIRQKEEVKEIEFHGAEYHGEGNK